MLALEAGSPAIDVHHLISAIDAEAVENAPTQHSIGHLEPTPKQELPLSPRLVGILSRFGEHAFDIDVDALRAALIAANGEDAN
jgi:hypothetical protein